MSPVFKTRQAKAIYDGFLPNGARQYTGGDFSFLFPHLFTSVWFFDGQNTTTYSICQEEDAQGNKAKFRLNEATRDQWPLKSHFHRPKARTNPASNLQQSDDETLLPFGDSLLICLPPHHITSL